MITKVCTLRAGPDTPNVDVIVKDLNLEEIWDSWQTEDDDGEQERKKIKQMEKESRRLEMKQRKVQKQIQAVKYKEAGEIVTNEEIPDKDEIKAKKKEGYADEIKQIWGPTLRDSDRQRDEKSDDDSDAEIEIDDDITDVIENKETGDAVETKINKTDTKIVRKRPRPNHWRK